MTTGADQVNHARRCSRGAGTQEGIRQDSTGRARVVVQCRECGRTDLDARLVDQLLDVDQAEGGGRRVRGPGGA